MQAETTSRLPERQNRTRLAVRVAALALGAGIALVAVVLAGFPEPMPRLVLVAVLTSLMLAAAAAGRHGLRQYRRRAETALIADLVRHDPAPALLVADDGGILSLNEAACSRFGGAKGNALSHCLRGLAANPSALIFRLHARARLSRTAHEDIAAPGGPLRLSVAALSSGYLWRIGNPPGAAAPRGERDAFPVPALTVARSGAILTMNRAARALVGGRAKTIDALFARQPLVSGEANEIVTASGAFGVAVACREFGEGRCELFVLPVARDASRGSGAIASLPVPMMKIAPSGRILAVNDQARALLGLDIGPDTRLGDLMEGLGRPIEDWLHAAGAGFADKNSEFLRLSRNDAEVYVQVSLGRVTEDGEPVLIALLNDATELKTLEAQFVQSQKMQAIGQLAGGVAHDFNNLLTAISGHCDLLLLRHDQGDQDYGDLVQINQNANRAAALVSQLLAFSRKQTLQPEVLDLGDTLADLTHLLNRLVGERVTLTLTHDPVLTPIRADKRQLEQVLMNLVVNARDAMPEGGEIRIETEVIVLARAIHRDRATVPPGDYVCVRVIDCGIGIAPDKLNKVFEPFYTTKRTGEGTGLGLSTAYGIVKQTGGYIFVDSVLGKGTTFIMYFPVHRGEPAPRPIEKAAARTMATSQGEGVVLLVEDEAPVRAFASRALRLRGYTVLEAESAEDALRTLEDPALDVDIFVTDVVMPGMDGPSWVREARKTRPDVRVIFVSGYAEGAFDGGIVTVPNSVFLSKPFSLNQLTETVHQQLH